MKDRGFIQVTVHGLTMDSNNNSPVVLLKDLEGKKVMPIWIGIFEANAIAMKLGDVEPPRPMTHDLAGSIMEAAGVSVEGVAVTELKDNIFFATIYAKQGRRKFTVDSRPSDAIALAVRTGCPINVKEDLFDQAAIDLSSIEEDRGEGDDNWTKLLEKMDPKDFSKYKM